jgi:hypothetical protein
MPDVRARDAILSSGSGVRFQLDKLVMASLEDRAPLKCKRCTIEDK